MGWLGGQWQRRARTRPQPRPGHRVFANFHPLPKTNATLLDRDYLSANSANIAGLATAEALLARLGPPVWPFQIDRTLAERGRAIFERPAAQGGCAECHGAPDSGAVPWKTASLDAGTDLRQWQIVLRSARTGTLEGAIVPGVVEPLKPTDLSLNILKTVVTGTLIELQASQAASGAPAPAALTAMTHDDMVATMHVPNMPAKMEAAPSSRAPAAAPPGTFVYEARVLHGIWAAAPYLHNGSVPSLAELLKPAAERVKEFKIGTAYDIKNVGLAIEQTGNFTLKTTGCEDRMSGNSNCGHDYGTLLPAAEKAALIEYLKAF